MPDRNYPPESDATICAECGEDLYHHRCAAVIRDLNDSYRTDLALVGVHLAKQELVITRGVAGRGNAFVDRALETVRKYRNFTVDNDPWGEHDFGKFELDDTELFWKIDYYDNELEWGSPDPADPALTRRVLTIMLAEEY